MTPFAYDIMLEAFKRQMLPVFSEITLPAMQAFGYAPLTESMLAAIFGAFVAVCCLYACGIIFAKRMLRKNPNRVEQLREKLGSTLLLTLLVVGSPFGFVLAFAAGYVRTHLGLSIGAALLGLFAHYGLHYAS